MRRRPPVPPRPAAALLAKRSELLAECAAQYWRKRKQLGPEQALRAVDSLFRQVKLCGPSWPAPEHREADLRMHILISAALARTVPSRVGTHGRPAHGAPHRSGSTVRRRLRKAG
jgi:hypothetical protein